MTGKYRTILLDVNGTLLGYEDPWGFEKRFANGIADYGIQATPEEVRVAIMPLVKQLMEIKNSRKPASSDEQYRLTFTWFYGSILDGLDRKSKSAHYGSDQDIAERLYERFIIKEGFMPPYDEAPDTLKQLKALDLRLGILSTIEPSWKYLAAPWHPPFLRLLCGLECGWAGETRPGDL